MRDGDGDWKTVKTLGSSTILTRAPSGAIRVVRTIDYHGLSREQRAQLVGRVNKIAAVTRQNPRTVRFHYATSDTVAKQVMVPCDWCMGGNLDNWIHTHPDYDIDQIWMIATSIAVVVHDLHQGGICLGALDCEHVFFDENERVIVGGFSFSRPSEQEVTWDEDVAALAQIMYALANRNSAACGTSPGVIRSRVDEIPDPDLRDGIRFLLEGAMANDAGTLGRFLMKPEPVLKALEVKVEVEQRQVERLRERYAALRAAGAKHKRGR